METLFLRKRKKKVFENLTNDKIKQNVKRKLLLNFVNNFFSLCWKTLRKRK